MKQADYKENNDSSKGTTEKEDINWRATNLHWWSTFKTIITIENAMKLSSSNW